MDEIDVSREAYSFDHLVSPLTVDNAPDFQILFDAKGDKNLCFRQILDQLDSLTVDSEPTVYLCQLHHM